MNEKEQDIGNGPEKLLPEGDQADPGTGRGNADMATMEPRGTTVTNAQVIKVSPKDGGDKKRGTKYQSRS
jgi:hypothetical protein